MDIHIKGIKVIYAEFIISLSVVKGSFDMKKKKSFRKKRNATPDFGFLTLNSNLGELFILYIIIIYKR